MSEQAWPTEEQFDLAHQHGTEFALQERAGGATEPQEAPLSGEWAGGLVPNDIATNVGYSPSDGPAHEGIDELADAWERGYNDAWAHSIEAQS